MSDDSTPTDAQEEVVATDGLGSSTGDGAAEVAAAAEARGMAKRPVRTDQLLDGEVQHVLVEPPRDPGIAPFVVGALAVAAVLGIVGVVAGLLEATILQGIAIGAALLLVAVALVLAATRMLPEELVVQERHETTSPSSTATSVDVTPVLGRRSILVAALAALATVGTALLVPARGIGPGAGDELRRTEWGAGVPAVDEEGNPVRADEVPVNGVVTVWPRGDEGGAQSQTMLLRVDPAALSDETLALGTGDGLIAYSKICTHAGCPISQFSADQHEPATGYLLVCPCHQSRFDVTQQAAPAGGPATRPLAQLPIEVADDGTVLATGDFTEPPGPAWWSR